MPSASDNLLTPIHLKIGDDFEWPKTERTFYLLTRDGLFLCRNHPFFRSSVRVDHWPTELKGHSPSLRLRYPKLPRRMMERVVGFFSIIGHHHGSEAAVLLAWNQSTESVEIIVPEQLGIVCPASTGDGSFGNAYPIKLYYEIPPLPSHLLLIGDIHSHVDAAAYASGTDKADEEFRPGLHIVVGRIQHEPPEFHCEVTVDGTRFRVHDLDMVLTGYEQRREDEVPKEWLEKVTVKPWSASKGYQTWRPPCGLSTQGDGVAGHQPADASHLISRPDSSSSMP